MGRDRSAWVARLSHSLIVLLAVPLGWLFWRRRAQLRPEDARAARAALLLSCLLDPWNIDYYLERWAQALRARFLARPAAAPGVAPAGP